jgi:hypothetical protein
LPDEAGTVLLIAKGGLLPVAANCRGHLCVFTHTTWYNCVVVSDTHGAGRPMEIKLSYENFAPATTLQDLLQNRNPMLQGLRVGVTGRFKDCLRVEFYQRITALGGIIVETRSIRRVDLVLCGTHPSNGWLQYPRRGRKLMAIEELGGTGINIPVFNRDVFAAIIPVLPRSLVIQETFPFMERAS